MYLSGVIFRNLYLFTSRCEKGKEKKDVSFILDRISYYIFILRSLFVTGLLEIIGFVIFSRVIQGVVFNNLLSFIIV